MALKVIGAGVGRTGTYSLKLALEQLGYGPCHHMEEVIMNPPQHVPLWSAAVQGNPDWEAAFKGYNSAVDWPSAAFWHELAEVYPQAKMILTIRNPESWYKSFSETIFQLLATADQAPTDVRPFLEMAIGVTAKTGFGGKSGHDDIIKAFTDHTDRVTKTIPAGRLLIYQVREGWEPLCNFLGEPVPSVPFPKTNNKEEFWDRLKGPAQ